MFPMADHGAASSDGAHQPEVMELIGSSDEADVITSSDDLELVQDEVVQGEVELNEAMALVQHEAEDDEVTMVDRWLDGTVRDDYMEIFCPPRVAPLLRSKGYRAGLSLDITSDLQLDFRTSGERGILPQGNGMPSAACVADMLSMHYVQSAHDHVEHQAHV